ncbi:putative metalloprotease CJM1_0395 family protein [Marinimicrobium agarilyticum]|uniref:putative metalloprotease CJM1_0395 family protein n=1 Tax=Marinimicrobium agarilyticum TaxID=306546 RepID=UPI0004158F3C|nr:putative metalloprotease CJM1_0395 family protein [Marinimicrobium agarilyticum]
MMPIPSNYANAVAPYAPLGRAPVGQEMEDLRASTLKPLEESAESARGENWRSPDQRPGEAEEQARLAKGRADAAGRDTGEGAEPTRSDDDVIISSGGRAAFASEAAAAPTQTNERPLVSAQQARGSEAQTVEDRARAENDIRASLERQQELETQKEVRELSERDREVRQHEQAHAALGGRYAGAPQYEYERGPDGVSYAVSGEVPIDTSAVPNDPQATIEKAQQIRRAAYAPAEPSDTDRRVAAQAAQMEAEARAELRRQQVEDVRAEAENSSEEAGSENRIQSETTGENPSGREEREREARDDSRQVLADETRRRNIDTYVQLVELSALVDSRQPGDRLDQRV